MGYAGTTGKSATARRFRKQERMLHLKGRLFIDLAGGPEHTIVLAGKGRSGTTWMADIINFRHDYRVIFEPFHPQYVKMCHHFGPKRYIRPESEDPRFLEPVQAILAGRVRTRWTDAQLYRNRGIIFRKRLVKTIRANLFLKWMKVHFPGTRIVLAIRHPCAVADSIMRQGWAPLVRPMLRQDDLVQDHLAPFVDAIQAAEDEFELHIFGWCIEHYVLFRQLAPDDVHLLFYESLLTDPETEVQRLFSFIGQEWDNRVWAVLGRPSVTTTRETREAILGGAKMIGRWRERLAPRQIDRAVEILNLFGLDRVYDDSPLPKPEGVLQVLQHGG